MRLMKRRLARLESLLPPAEPEDPAREARWGKVVRRLVELLDRAWPLLTEAEQGRVGEALGLLPEHDGPYASWLWDLGQGRCRLPDLPAAAMKDLLLAWLSP